MNATTLTFMRLDFTIGKWFTRTKDHYLIIENDLGTIILDFAGDIESIVDAHNLDLDRHSTECLAIARSESESEICEYQDLYREVENINALAKMALEQIRTDNLAEAGFGKEATAISWARVALSGRTLRQIDQEMINAITQPIKPKSFWRRFLDLFEPNGSEQ
jgi:hypothetical protein